MSGRDKFKAVQGASHSCHNEYEALQETILRRANVTCSVMVFPDRVSLRTASYADYVLARNAIKGSVSLPIVYNRQPDRGP